MGEEDVGGGWWGVDEGVCAGAGSESFDEDMCGGVYS